MIKVKLIRSVIGCRADHRATIRGLGLRKLQSTKVLQDTPSIRGMIEKVCYLIQVEEVKS